MTHLPFSHKSGNVPENVVAARYFGIPRTDPPPREVHLAAIDARRGLPRDAVERSILAEPCDRCGAAPGEPCTSRGRRRPDRVAAYAHSTRHCRSLWRAGLAALQVAEDVTGDGPPVDETTAADLRVRLSHARWLDGEEARDEYERVAHEALAALEASLVRLRRYAGDEDDHR